MMFERSFSLPPASPNLWMVVMSTLRTSCAEQRLQLLPRRHADHVRHVGRVERGGDLRVEVDAVHHDDHRRVAQLRDACRSFCAANTISSDLPLPWKCQIRPFFG